MNSGPRPKHKPQDESDVDEEDHAASHLTSSASEADSSDGGAGARASRRSPSRPHAGFHERNIHDEDQTSEEDSEAETSRPKHPESAPRTTAAGRSGSARTQDEQVPSPDQDLARLKDAVNAKFTLQPRQRPGYSSGLGTYANTKRISPIKEEGISPSVSPGLPADFIPAQFESIRTTSTVSTESTESQRTVRGFTPAAGETPLRTPSYPFPYIPGTPRSWSSAFHQPFTALSPTSASAPRPEHDIVSKGSGMASSVDTPLASAQFAPPGEARHVPEDPRFPTPNLYNLTLQLNAEPGVEEWWATVTNLLHDNFKAERATLIVPVDSTDIENTPWGQKATFSMNGPEVFVSHSTVEAQTAGVRTYEAVPESGKSLAGDVSGREVTSKKPHADKPRPQLQARHSYAGHDHKTQPLNKQDKDHQLQAKTGHAKGTTRPAGPRRYMTHAADMTGSSTLPRVASHTPASRQPSMNDPEFSTVVGGVDAGPHADIFPTLQSLDREHRPLIEPSGISRVLRRGRVVTVIRDYSSDSADSVSTTPITPAASVQAKQERLFGDYRSVFSSDNSRSHRRDYEEYEQPPTSPWAQSPAPSPAIQADEDRNPFFASEEQQVEDSFNPAISPKDYSQISQVQAIGVDHASTLIHIPLVHPTISQPMQSLRMSEEQKDRPGHLQRSNTIDPQRMAPIAILSVLTAIVPYPTNLIHSLQLLGPHLATSFFNSQQYSALRGKAVQIRRRVPAPGETITYAPMTVELASIEGIAYGGYRQGSDQASETITSPSEYSNRSKNSPSGSMSGTPGWESHVWTPSRSVPSTPAYGGGEKSDDYFEASKRHKGAAQIGSAAHSSSSSTKTSRKMSGAKETKGPVPAASDDPAERLEETKARPHQADRNDPAASSSLPIERTAAEHDARRHVRPVLPHLPELAKQRQHSLLHSYGADYQSSFGAWPVAGAGLASDGRKRSFADDVPPPSEKLLRLIIDSVPVQIFTARPETGELNWVNGKLLLYRGQEARQVIADPWEAIHPDEREDFVSVWHRSLRTNQQMSQKVRLRNSEGEFRWFFIRCLPLKNAQQKVVHWIGTMMDFHEQHVAELSFAHQKETEASQAKYKALANSSPQIVFAAQKARGITFCNTQWLQYSGQTQQESLGQGFLDHVHPDDLGKCRFPVFEEGSNQPTNVPTSLPIEPKRSISASAMSSSGSSETEKASTDTDATATPLSQATQLMPQRKLAELASTGILKVTRDADGRPSYSTEVRLKSKDNDFRWHLVRVVLADPFDESEGEGTWYGTCTDINDHKALERDLKETMDEKSRFLSNMSHEIRTPLNGITGMVNFLMDSNLTPEQMEHVNIIRTSTEGLRGLINDILDLSKAEAGMITLNTDWLYPTALIEEVNDLTSTMAIDKGLELNYLVDEAVPAVVKGDKFRIRQILLNTVGNAIKFTQQGEVFVRCSQQVDEHEELGKEEMFLRFDVIDTGRGFTDQEAEFLFKRFSQIDGSSTRQHGGTGLGLVISRQLAQLHGGDMTAIGVPQKGSTFTFFLKVGLVSEGLQSISSKQREKASPVLPSVSTVASLPAAEIEAARSLPRFVQDMTESPAPNLPPTPDTGKASSSAPSSASSDPSVRSAARTSTSGSARSSASSFLPDPTASSAVINLSLPADARRSSSLKSQHSISRDISKASTGPPAAVDSGKLSPPMFSILVVAPLKHSREATVTHIDRTLPKNVPHQITSRESFEECRELLSGPEPITFSHVVIILHNVAEIIAIMSQVLGSDSSTSVVLITDLAQRKQIIEQAPQYNVDKLVSERRLVFIFKPLKPSRLGRIFDPQKEREMSTDHNQDSAQQVATNQKMVFEELKTRLGNKDKRVLLVEDNKVNQMVLLKYFAKSMIKVDTVLDGVQCTDKVFASPPGYYSIILCDLHMPNKDGYQTCKEIRRWERKEHCGSLPIIALSANVLGDVYQKCVDAGFNDYMTKPVDFKELSKVLLKFMDPPDPTKPHEMMKMRNT